MIAEVITRLKARCPEFGGRIEGAAELSALMVAKQLPQHNVSAYVFPLGLQGGAADSANIVFTQFVTQQIGVLITLRTFTPTGAKATDDLEALITSVLSGLLGWGPDTAPGVFRLVRGQTVNMNAGTIVYQIDLALMDQLRISP